MRKKNKAIASQAPASIDILTSVAGSNIFFNSKHSLGVPIGSEAMVTTCAGRTGIGRMAVGLMGIVIDCCNGADPFSTGTPRDATALQKDQVSIHTQPYKQ